MRRASRKVGAPTGMIMNSWKSMGLSACTPPLTMFIIGTGSKLRLGAADIAIKRQARRHRRRLGHRQRNAQNGVGAQPRLVGRAVQRDHRLVDAGLLLGFHAAQRVENSPLTAATAFSTPLPP